MEIVSGKFDFPLPRFAALPVVPGNIFLLSLKQFIRRSLLHIELPFETNTIKDWI